MNRDNQDIVWLDGRSLTVEGVMAVARRRARAAFAPEGRAALVRSWEALQRLIDGGRRIYGITTGFGALDGRSISVVENALQQRNLILSHAAGVGPPAPVEVVRAMMLLRANVLATGTTGARPIVAERLLEMLNRGVHPIVPQQGSVGACGDLAPLAHMVLPLIGEGEAEFEGRLLPGAAAMAAAGLEVVELRGRDGLALINGTEQGGGTGAVVLADALAAIRAAEVAAAMSLEALDGLSTAFDARVHRAKPHPGQVAAAENVRRLIAGSGIIDRSGHPSRIRDNLALRCVPQVMGAARDALAWATAVLNREINSANDNPLVFAEDLDINSNAGNFHGQHVGVAMDLVSNVLTSVGVMSERRTARLVDEGLNRGLPAFLIRPPAGQEGLHSGLMLPQYTAASLVAECRVLCSPASVHSIPTSANSEDHVSMCSISARNAQQILANLQHIVAIELLTAAQGLEFRLPRRPGRGAQAAWDLIRSRVPRLEADRCQRPDIEAVTGLVRSGELLAAVESAIGPLA